MITRSLITISLLGALLIGCAGTKRFIMDQSDVPDLIVAAHSGDAKDVQKHLAEVRT